MSTRGFSLSVSMAGGPGGAPIPGDFNTYLDVVAGLDTNDGHDWTHAFLTWERAALECELQFATSPDTENIIVNVANNVGGVPAIAPTQAFSFSPALPDRVRVHIVCPTTMWAVLAAHTGNVTIGGVVIEAGSSLARVTVAGGAPAADDVGKTLRLARPAGDPNVGAFLCFTILAVEGQDYTVSTRHVDMPAWIDADDDTVATVIQPPSVLNGVLTFAPTCGPVVDTALYAPKNWLVGIRANGIVIAGEETAMALCEARSFAAVTQDGPLVIASPGGARGDYIFTPILGLTAYMSVAHGVAWGLWGATAGDPHVANHVIGNGARTLSSYGGPQTSFAGYVTKQMSLIPDGTMNAERFRCEYVDASHGAQLVARYFRVRGAGQASCIRAAGEGTNVETTAFAIEAGVAGGPASIILSEQDARVEIHDTDIVVKTAVPADYPINGFVCDGARLELDAGITDDLAGTVNGILISVDNMGEVECVGAINMVKARPGVAAVSDILVNNESKMVLRGNIQKTVPNTIPSRCIDVDRGSKFIQASGTFTHGAAPANWTNSYLLGGLIHVDHGSKARIGTVADGAVGAGAGTAITARHGSQIWFQSNGAMTGAAAVICGVKAAVAYAAIAAAVLNDLPIAPNGAEELCVVGVE
jgi:hypothetical protein